MTSSEVPSPALEYDRIRKEIKEEICLGLCSTIQNVLNHEVAMGVITSSANEIISMKIYHISNKLNESSAEDFLDYLKQLHKQMNDEEQDYIRNWERYQKFQREHEKK